MESRAENSYRMSTGSKMDVDSGLENKNFFQLLSIKIVWSRYRKSGRPLESTVP